MRARPVVILAGLCVGLIFVVRLQIRSYLEDGYNVLPLVYIDFVKGDTFSNPLDIMALAERVSVPQNGSYVFISVLTATKFHDARLSRMFVSWMQTVEPKQLHIITDGKHDMWTQALANAGITVIFSNCPRDRRKSRRMMCCKGGTQFEQWYRAKEAGEVYKWYCHFDDDVYVNTRALYELVERYNAEKDHYLGNWKQMSARAYHNKDRISQERASGLSKYSERKRDDYRYANGPAYCISASLMVRLEKYLRGKNFEENCIKADVDMDDILPGLIIEGVLGVEITHVPELSDNFYTAPVDDLAWYKRKATVTTGKIHLSSPKFHGRDRLLMYHCLLYPHLSWCK